ncbi:MAG: hypothetical protein ACYS26_02480 [Planctomycetota bacterium]|jgi:hypothetical protein
METLFIIPIFLLVALTVRLFAGALDGDRIDAYARDRGWDVRRKSWRPFGPGWFGEKNARIYEIEYIDREGHRHLAHVKTSMFSGVYITDDTITEHAERAPDSEQGELASAEALEAENAALRQRLAELEARAAHRSQ